MPILCRFVHSQNATTAREPSGSRACCRADSLTVLAKRHLDISLVVHGRLGGDDEKIELVVEDLRRAPEVRST